MSVIFGVLFLTVLGTTLGVPIPETANVLHGWVPAPRSRGTFNIITSCVITLVLCVWTAIHPDIVHKVRPWQRYKNKIGLMLRALLTPDRVIMHSYNQWRDAERIHQLWLDKDKVKLRPKALKEHLNSGLRKYGPYLKIKEEDDVPDSVGDRSGGDLLGIEGAFFLVMRGYTTRGNPLSLGEFEELAVWQIREVGGQLKRLDVIDKGKASTLAKVISCLQASWLVLQLLARKAAGLPVTQFELHVFVQVLITAGLYWFWWGKPLDVNEPIELFIAFGPILPQDYKKPPPEIPKLFDFMETILLLEPFLKAFIWSRKAPGVSLEPSHEPSGAPKPPTDSEKAPSATTATLSESSEKSSQSRKPSAEALEVPVESRETPVELSKTPPESSGAPKPPTEPEEVPSATTETLSESFEKSSQSRKPSAEALEVPVGSQETSVGLLKTPPKSSETPTESSEPPAEPSEEAVGPEVLDILKEHWPRLIFYLLYGGLHAIAWNSQFPTLVELWLWRASCLVVAAAPAGLVIDMCIRCRFCDMSLKGYRGFLHHLLTILYTMSSMFLLVESFIGLRQLPGGAYETVTWGNYIPHF